MKLRDAYDRLPNTLKKLIREVYYAVPGTERWKRERWVRNVYTKAMHDQRRHIFISIAHYAHINRPTSGYYFEFGSHGANTMRMAYDTFRYLFDFTYVSFDSFVGLPEIADIDKQDIWQKGKLKTSEDDFRRICISHGMSNEKLITVPGFYDQSLGDATAKRFDGKAAAVIYIDSDLYESAVPVLRFVERFIVVGSVIVFDDWNCFHGDPNRGERRAFREFCQLNPNLQFEPFVATGMQSSFICVGT